MAKNDKGAKLESGAPGQQYEGHGDDTQPAGILSPATFVPLAAEPTSVNQKSVSGKKGKVE
jgi:hypothetical protein